MQLTLTLIAFLLFLFIVIFDISRRINKIRLREFKTSVGILTFISRKNSSLGLSVPKKTDFLIFFYTYEHLKFHAQLS